MRLQPAMFGYSQIGMFGSLMLTIRVEGFVYLGCYMDSKDERVLPNVQLFFDKITPAECARRCIEYRYAGVEYTWECYCGSTLNATAMPDSECYLDCPGDKNTKCGGDLRISIYTNWVTACGPPPAIANGNATLPKGTNLTYGSIADVYCDPGFISKTTITCLSNTSWEMATCERSGVGVGIGLAVGIFCAVGAVVVIVVQRRRGALTCKNRTTTETNDNTTAGSLTLAVGSYENTGENHNYCVKSFEGTVEHYDTADEHNEDNNDTDHYYSTEVTEEPYECVKDGNDEYDYTTNTIASQSDSRKPDNIYNKLKRDRSREYDHMVRLEHNMPRPGNDYDTTDAASRNDGVGDYNHIVTRGNGTKDLAQGGYDVLHGIKITLPPCNATDYAHAKM